MTMRTRSRTIALIVAALLLVGPAWWPMSVAAENDPTDRPVYRLAWGSDGTGPGQFIGSVGLAVSPSGDVYASDPNGLRVQQFDAHGMFVREWGEPGTGPGQLDRLRGVAVDSLGFVYTVHSYRVQKFTAEGVFVTQWGDEGSDPGEFRSANGIAVDWADDTVFVADDEFSGDRVQRFSADGTFLNEWRLEATGGEPGPLAARDGIVYSSQDGGAVVDKYSNVGEHLARFGGGLPRMFDRIQDLDVDSDGFVYTAESTAEVVQKLSPSGEVQYVIDDSTAGPGGFLVNVAVSVGPHGRVYTAEGTPRRIKLFSPAAPYPDVPAWVDESVGWLAYHDYVSGFGDGMYRPADPITRAAKARVLYRIAGEPDVTGLPDHGFSDVPAWVQDAVTWLRANDYISGYDDGTFRPYEPITRAAEARVLYRIAGEPDVTGLPEHGFSDVPAWVQDPVTWLKANGYMTGYGDGTFRPAEPITRAEEARVLFRINA